GRLGRGSASKPFEAAADPAATPVGRRGGGLSRSPRSDEAGAAGAEGNPAGDPSGGKKRFASLRSGGPAVPSGGKGAAAAESERRRIPSRRGGEGGSFRSDPGKPVHRAGCGDQRGKRCPETAEGRFEGSRGLAGETGGRSADDQAGGNPGDRLSGESAGGGSLLRSLRNPRPSREDFLRASRGNRDTSHRPSADGADRRGPSRLGDAFDAGVPGAEYGSAGGDGACRDGGGDQLSKGFLFRGGRSEERRVGKEWGERLGSVSGRGLLMTIRTQNA